MLPDSPTHTLGVEYVIMFQLLDSLLTYPAKAMSQETFFREMTASTQADWMKIIEKQKEFFAALPDRILDHMRLLGDDYGGFPVDRLQHCLQTADLAAEDGRRRRVCCGGRSFMTLATPSVVSIMPT